MANAYSCDRCDRFFKRLEPLTQEGEVYETATERMFRIDYELTIDKHGQKDAEPELCVDCRRDILNAVAANIQRSET